VLLALTGINQALAPEISGAFFSGDRNHVQKMTAMTALGSGAAALVILLSFVVLGHWILAIFDPAYATPTMHAVLVIFGIGATIASVCGPVDLLMQLTGLQHYLMKLLIGVNIVGLALTALLTWQFGALGVAFGMAGTSATACLLGTMICRRKLDIDPSILGLFRGRLQRRPDPVARGAS
jgi:O-antigen/teichoic acid export membrane protein